MPTGQRIPWTTGHIIRMKAMRERGASYQGIAAALYVYEGVETTTQNVQRFCRKHGFAPKPHGVPFKGIESAVR